MSDRRKFWQRSVAPWSVVVLTALLLVGCGKEISSEGGTSGTYEYVEVSTPNGPIDCIVWDGARAGNITCDWESN